jgi:hypothetical protein
MSSPETNYHIAGLNSVEAEEFVWRANMINNAIDQFGCADPGTVDKAEAMFTWQDARLDRLVKLAQVRLTYDLDPDTGRRVGSSQI